MRSQQVAGNAGGGDDGHDQQGSRDHDGLSAPPQTPWRGRVSTDSPYAISHYTDRQTGYCPYYPQRFGDSRLGESVLAVFSKPWLIQSQYRAPLFMQFIGGLAFGFGGVPDICQMR